MRRVEAPIEAAFRDGQKYPYLFRTAGDESGAEVVKLFETWVKESKWWRPEGSERRVYYRVVADPGKCPNVLCVLCKAEAATFRPGVSRRSKTER